MQPENWRNTLVFGRSHWQCEGLHKCFEGNGEEDLLKWKYSFGPEWHKCLSPTHTCHLLIKTLKGRTKTMFQYLLWIFLNKRITKMKGGDLSILHKYWDFPSSQSPLQWPLVSLHCGEQGAKDTCLCPRRTWGLHLPFPGGCPEYAF